MFKTTFITQMSTSRRWFKANKKKNISCVTVNISYAKNL